TAEPDGGVTVIVTGFVRCGNRNRCCRVGGSYLRPIPPRSPEAEWHLPHPPAPLKYCSPAFASPVSTFCTRYAGEFLSVSLNRCFRKWESSSTCFGVKFALGVLL